MAEVAATAIGIAGLVSVLQNLLQCYKVFAKGRDFPRDLTTLMLQAALIDNSTRSWAEAVGLIDRSETPGNSFLIKNPKENAVLAIATLKHMEQLMIDANKTLDEYNFSEEPLAPEEVGSSLAKEEASDNKRKVLQKLSRVASRISLQESPNMARKRMAWSLGGKESLEKKLGAVTKLLDHLNTDFKPINPDIQMRIYRSSLEGLGIEQEEMVLIARVAVAQVEFDQVSRKFAASVIDRQATTTSNTFDRIKLTNQAMLNRGDFVDSGYVSTGGEPRGSSKNVFKVIEGGDQTMIIIGNQYGGKSPMEIAQERMRAAMELSAMNTARPQTEKAGSKVEVSELESLRSQL
ncbi:hypothetical protein VE03_01401 [Pseudogymnoascus sp. 23342-1-I1]|nr:hypothetical protein VE03_01401 [Pseudogymnoascus sp. 23342-1-I1]